MSYLPSLFLPLTLHPSSGTNIYNPLHARAGHDAVNRPFRSLPQLAAATALPQMQLVQVQVPVGISPGMQFQIQVGQQIMAVACPQGAGPGSMIQIQVPAQQVSEAELKPRRAQRREY